MSVYVYLCSAEIRGCMDITRHYCHWTRRDSIFRASREPVWYDNPSGGVIGPNNTKHKHRWSGQCCDNSATVLQRNSASPKPGKRRRVTLIIFAMEQCR